MKKYAQVNVFDDDKLNTDMTEMRSEFRVTAEGISSEVSKKVGNNEVVSRINQSAEGVAISAQKVDITGVITAINQEGKTTIDGGRITAGSIGIGQTTGIASTQNVTDAISTAASDATTKANNAAKTATNYISASSSGIRIASANPATQNQRLELTSSKAAFYDSGNIQRVGIDGSTGVVVGNPNKGHTTVNDNGLYIYDVNSKKRSSVLAEGLNIFDTDGSTSVALFGSTARVGAAAETNIQILSTGADAGIKFKTKYKPTGSGTYSTFNIGDIGFDSTAGWTNNEAEDNGLFPKGAWFTLGYRIGTKGYYSLVNGFRNVAAHNASVAFGIHNQVYGSCGMAIGMYNVVGSSSYTSINSYSTENLPGNNSLAAGYWLQATGESQIVCGTYNVANDNAAFIVGTGSSSARRNSFTVNYNNTINGSRGLVALWSGVYYMSASQTVNLSQSISEQLNGIVLAWSAYVDGEEKNYAWQYTFIPKSHVAISSGTGIGCGPFANAAFTQIGCKYVYVSDKTITGNDDNSKTGTSKGVTYNNKYWVLRYVYGV